MQLFVLAAILVASASANIMERPCLGPMVNCFVDPCAVSRGCPAYPEAVCRSNYCGGCFADYYVGHQKVKCDSPLDEIIAEAKPHHEVANMAEIKPAVRGVCPKTENMIGLCAEMCNNCESKGQLCCSNGCGHQCMNPVMPEEQPVEQAEEKRQFHFTEEECPPHGMMGACIVSCSSHSDCASIHRCCSTGCGRLCKPAYFRNETSTNHTGMAKKSDEGEEEVEEVAVGKRDFPIRYECPAVLPGNVGLCMSNCETDDDCNDGPVGLSSNATMKCCSNGCGKICRAGVLPLKAGRCPNPPSFGPCVMTCASHYHCEGDGLCCPHGCGQICKKPVFD